MTDSASEPQHLSHALSDLIARRGLARVRGARQLDDIWREVAGDKIATHSKAIAVNRGILQIGVASSALLGELASFHKLSLLQTLQERHPQLKVRDLKFRLKSDLARRTEPGTPPAS